MKWINTEEDRLPEDGSYVLVGFQFGVGIAQYINGEWDTVGANRRHYIFTNKEKLYSSCQPLYWMPLPEAPQ